MCGKVKRLTPENTDSEADYSESELYNMKLMRDELESDSDEFELDDGRIIRRHIDHLYVCAPIDIESLLLPNPQPSLQKENTQKEQTDEVQPTLKPADKQETERQAKKISIPEPKPEKQPIEQGQEQPRRYPKRNRVPPEYYQAGVIFV